MISNRVNEIDLLRFVAALSVVLFHYTFRGYAADGMSSMPYPLLAPIAKYGYLGVNLFFIISGFVILMTAANGSLRGFVVSRLIRLYPAFWACCTISFAAIGLMGDTRYSASIDQYLINMTMLSGFLGIPAIDGVYWSLFVELRFYALVALILAIGRIHQTQSLMTAWLIGSIILEIVPIGKFKYLLVTEYSAYFIAGSMFFLVWSKGVSPTKVGIITASCALAIYQSLKTLSGFSEHYNTNMSSYTVSGIIGSFFVVMFFVSIRRTGFFASRSYKIVGALTYPLYLLHQTVGFMIFNFAYPALSEHLILWGVVVTMLGASYGVNVLIEKRLSSSMKSWLNRSFDCMYRIGMRFNERVRIRR